MIKTRHLAPPLLLISCAGPLQAAGDPVSAIHKYTWSENCGWLNWRDAGDPAGSRGVRFESTFAHGLIWSANIGWIHLGDGTPGLQSRYRNLDGSDAGVNLEPDGRLSGFAWSPNVGWINFGRSDDPGHPGPARLDRGQRRLRGYAWGENIGWLNLDDADAFVAVACPADLDDGSFEGTPDGGVTLDDLLFYLDAYDRGVSPADLDDGSATGVPDGGVGIEDLLYFLTRYETGC